MNLSFQTLNATGKAYEIKLLGKELTVFIARW
jgi:hypothetical protein